ncbi:MAG: hypothetical protein J7J93_02040 [Candidatus Aenigmarchaeota archaeon]|nr:hypothetical protein [Candidatus Aenigmarchaeota archaeon]
MKIFKIILFSLITLFLLFPSIIKAPHCNLDNDCATSQMSIYDCMNCGIPPDSTLPPSSSTPSTSTPPPTQKCECSDWTYYGCGSGGCAQYQKYGTRTCTGNCPSNTKTERCLNSEACGYCTQDKGCCECIDHKLSPSEWMCNGENEYCASDCTCKIGEPHCGDGVCDTCGTEDCLTCPEDCPCPYGYTCVENGNLIASCEKTTCEPGKICGFSPCMWSYTCCAQNDCPPGIDCYCYQYLLKCLSTTDGYQCVGTGDTQECECPVNDCTDAGGTCVSGPAACVRKCGPNYDYDSTSSECLTGGCCICYGPTTTPYPPTSTTTPSTTICTPNHPEPCGGEGKLEGMYCPVEGEYSWKCQKNEGGTLSVSFASLSDIVDIEISDPCGQKKTKRGMSSCSCNKKGEWTVKLKPIEIHSPYTIQAFWTPLTSCTSDDDCPNCYEKCDIDGSITGTPNICYDFRPLLTNTCRYYDYCENGYIPGTTTPCSPFDDYCYNAQSELCNDSNYACHAWFSC